MAKEKIDVLVEGGKATAAPPLGPALGPMGVNIGQVVSEINNKTSDFKGMKVPVTVVIDKDTKSFEITVGTPPASQLIKKEAGIDKASGNPKTDFVADLVIEQIIKIAKMKQDSLLGKDMFQKVKEIIGTCQSMGIMVEGKPAHDAIEAINKGEFKEQIASGKTEITQEERKALEEERKHLQEEMEKRRAEFEAKAKEILSAMQGKTRAAIKAKMVEEELPMQIINEMLPEEEEKKESGGAPAQEPVKE